MDPTNQSIVICLMGKKFLMGTYDGGGRLVVMVPFTRMDLPALERSLVAWSQVEPCGAMPVPPSGEAAGLLYVYNGRCSASFGSCARVRQLINASAVVRDCFSRPMVLGASLSGRADRYDKQRRSGSWTAGPNGMFHFAFERARRMGFRHMLQLEVDVLPIRPGWLTRAEEIAARTEAWILGSALLASCTREETTGECVENLPEEIAEHINGNALYAVGDDSFAAYVQESGQGRMGRMPYDLALHVHWKRYSQPQRRQLLHRFQYSTFILNMGTSSPDMRQLASRYPNCFLVHSSAFSHVNATTRLPALGGEMPSDRSSGGTGAADPNSTAGLDLAPLARLAGPGRTVIAAFVAGALYQPMCRNYLAHMRQAGVQRHILIALDGVTAQWLLSEGASVMDASQVVKLPQGGSDEFGSAAFFAINGARYRVLQAVLEAGISIFVLDLDVVVLRDPLEWLEQEGKALAANRELLLQSDARDGTTQTESDPDLLERRLGLVSRGNWTYVNGGVFFCRASSRSAALFRKIWSVLSAAATPPNEQDVLNRELAVTNSLAWGVLPPSEFPNGFVYFTRPLPGLHSPVLVHANWVAGVEEKVYRLREAGMWSVGPEAPAAPQERFLSIGDGIDHGHEGAMGFAAHRRALRDALAIAAALNRTLILPRFPLFSGGDGGEHERRSTTVAHFVDYAALTRQFPKVSANRPLESLGPTTRVHIDIGRGDEPPAKDRYAVIRRRPSGLTSAKLRHHLAPFSSAQVLHLHAAYRRHRPPSDPTLKARFSRGLQLSPRLQNLAQLARRKLRRSRGRFDCVDGSNSSEFGASLHSPSEAKRGTPATISSTELVRAAADTLAEERRSVLVINVDSPAAQAAARLLAGRVVRLEELVPPWYMADFDSVGSSATPAREAVELQVCAHAERFIGNLAAPSTNEVCFLRSTELQLQSRGTQGPKRSLLLWKSGWCEDAFARQLPSTAVTTPERP